MAPGFDMYNSYNTNTNPWIKFASDCFGFVNTNSMSVGSPTGGFNISNPMFNHDGSINYGRSCGIGAAYATVGLLNMFVSSVSENKDPKVNYTEELKTVTETIATKESNKAEQVDISNNQGAIIETATAELAKFKAELGDSTTGLIKELNDATTNYETALKNKDNDNIANLKSLMELAQDKVDKKKADITAKEKEIETATELKQAADKLIESIDKALPGLKERQEILQGIVDKQAIVNTHVTGKKADKNDAENWYNIKTTKGVDTDNYPTATSEQLKRAHSELSDAMRHNKAEDIAKWKKIFIEMYETNPDTFAEVGDFKATYNRLKRQA